MHALRLAIAFIVLVNVAYAARVFLDPAVSCSPTTGGCDYNNPDIWDTKTVPTNRDDVFLVSSTTRAQNLIKISKAISAVSLTISNATVILTRPNYCKNACQNGGVCPVPDGIVCNCTGTGYTGVHCEIPITGDMFGELTDDNMQISIPTIAVDNALVTCTNNVTFRVSNVFAATTTAIITLNEGSKILAQEIDMYGTLQANDYSAVESRIGTYGGLVEIHSKASIYGESVTLGGVAIIDSIRVSEFDDVLWYEGNYTLSAGIISNSFIMAPGYEFFTFQQAQINGELYVGNGGLFSISNLNATYNNLVYGPILADAGGRILLDNSRISFAANSINSSDISQGILELTGNSSVVLNNILLGEVISNQPSTHDIRWLEINSADASFSTDLDIYGDIFITPNFTGVAVFPEDIDITLTGCVLSFNSLAVEGYVTCTGQLPFVQTASQVPGAVLTVDGVVTAHRVHADNLILTGTIVSTHLGVTESLMVPTPANLKTSENVTIGGQVSFTSATSLLVLGDFILNPGVVITVDISGAYSGQPLIEVLSADSVIIGSGSKVVVNTDNGFPSTTTTFWLVSHNSSLVGSFEDLSLVGNNAEGKSSGSIKIVTEGSQVGFTFTPTPLHKKTPGWAIALIVIGVLAGLAVFGFFAYRIVLKKRQKQEYQPLN